MRKRKPHAYKLVASMALLVISPSIQAGLVGASMGIGNPPSTLGGWDMVPFGFDGRPLDDMVTSVTDPNGRQLTFNQELRHDQVGMNWGTWSHGYLGDVYDTASSDNPTDVTLDLPDPVHAFYFYAEPVNFDNFTVTATAQDGTTVSQIVNGHGNASGFGFYTTTSGPGDLIASITVTASDTDGFALGEFGVDRTAAAPDSGTSLGYSMISLVALGLCGLRFGRQARETLANS